MRPWILGSLAALALVVGATAAVRAPDGEWIESVDGETAEIWAVGDADPPRAARVARVIRRADPDRILYVGDVYPRGTRADFRRWARPWGRLVRRMAPTPGNHDGPRAAEGFDPYWRRITGDLPPTFYSFEAAGWQILQVNSEQPRRRPVVRWLREQIEDGGNCRIAFWHRPRYTAGHHKGGDPRAVAYWDAIAERARIVVNGHDHNLQRFRERDGIVEFISGAGGRRLYPVDRRHPRLAWSDDRHFGALRLSLSPGEARWRFVSARGKRLDSGTLRCRP